MRVLGFHRSSAGSAGEIHFELGRVEVTEDGSVVLAFTIDFAVTVRSIFQGTLTLNNSSGAPAFSASLRLQVVPTTHTTFQVGPIDLQKGAYVIDISGNLASGGSAS